MNKYKKYPKETKSVKYEDLSSISSNNKPYAFRAETSNPIAKSMNSSEIMLALYSGVLKSEEVEFDFIEIDGGQDVPNDRYCSLHGRTSCGSVAIVCDSETVHTDAIGNLDSSETNMNTGSI